MTELAFIQRSGALVGSIFSFSSEIPFFMGGGMALGASICWEGGGEYW